MSQKIVEITWVDATSRADEHQAHEAPKPPRVRTYGLLVERNESYVVVAQERLEPAETGGTETYRATTTIPRNMIERGGFRVVGVTKW
jgi:hypothetical protein